MKEKEPLVLCHALRVLQSLFVFRSAAQQYPVFPTHTQSQLHRGSELAEKTTDSHNNSSNGLHSIGKPPLTSKSPS